MSRLRIWCKHQIAAWMTVLAIELGCIKLQAVSDRLNVKAKMPCRIPRVLGSSMVRASRTKYSTAELRTRILVRHVQGSTSPERKVMKTAEAGRYSLISGGSSVGRKEGSGLVTGLQTYLLRWSLKHCTYQLSRYKSALFILLQHMLILARLAVIRKELYYTVWLKELYVYRVSIFPGNIL